MPIYGLIYRKIGFLLSEVINKLLHKREIGNARELVCKLERLLVELQPQLHASGSWKCFLDYYKDIKNPWKSGLYLVGALISVVLLSSLGHPNAT